MKSLDNIIEFNNVSFQYQSDAAFTLNNVSFTIPSENGLQLLDTMGQVNQLLLN